MLLYCSLDGCPRARRDAPACKRIVDETVGVVEDVCGPGMDVVRVVISMLDPVSEENPCLPGIDQLSETIGDAHHSPGASTEGEAAVRHK